MENIGEILKKTREAQHLSLADVAAETNIRTIFLEALENNDFNAFPGEVFFKGALRSYGNYLGLDGAKLVEQFKAGKSGESATEAKPATHEIRETKNVAVNPSFRSKRDIGSGTGSNKGKVLTSLFAAAIVLLCACGIYYFTTSSGKINFPISLPSISFGGEEKASDKDSAKKAEAPKKEEAKKSAEPAAAAAAPAAKPAEPAKAAAPAPATDKVTLKLTSTGKCWMHITNAAGKVLFEGIMTSGQSSTFTDAKLIRVQYGNIKDMQIEVNGKKLPQETTVKPVERIYKADGAK